jgi:hypothetical protein
MIVHKETREHVTKHTKLVNHFLGLMGTLHLPFVYRYTGTVPLNTVENTDSHHAGAIQEVI